MAGVDYVCDTFGRHRLGKPIWKGGGAVIAGEENLVFIYSLVAAVHNRVSVWQNEIQHECVSNDIVLMQPCLLRCD